MQFQGPEAADLANVQSLNLAFLEALVRSQVTSEEPSGQGVVARLAGLPWQHHKRISASPFLIFSLEERDERRWQRLFDGFGSADLVDSIERPTDEIIRLVTATLAFLWQLSKKNPYAVRVLSGASLSWCDRLSASALVDLLRRVADETGMISLRRHNNLAFWNKIMRAGASEEHSVRRAALLSALQTVLTDQPAQTHTRLPAAACSMPAPTKIAVNRDNHQR